MVLDDVIHPKMILSGVSQHFISDYNLGLGATNSLILISFLIDPKMIFIDAPSVVFAKILLVEKFY